MMVTTGGRGCSVSEASGESNRPSSTSAAATRRTLWPSSSATIWAVSGSSTSVIFTSCPSFIRMRITSTARSAMRLASSCTVIASGITTSRTIFSVLGWKPCSCRCSFSRLRRTEASECSRSVSDVSSALVTVRRPRRRSPPGAALVRVGFVASRRFGAREGPQGPDAEPSSSLARAVGSRRRDRFFAKTPARLVLGATARLIVRLLARLFLGVAALGLGALACKSCVLFLPATRLDFPRSDAPRPRGRALPAAHARVRRARLRSASGAPRRPCVALRLLLLELDRLQRGRACAPARPCRRRSGQAAAPRASSGRRRGFASSRRRQPSTGRRRSSGGRCRCRASAKAASADPRATSCLYSSYHSFIGS